MIQRLIGGNRRREKAVTTMSPESGDRHKTITILKRWNAEKNIDSGSLSPFPSPCSSPARLPPRPRSLDLPSFRVINGNLSEIYEKIGVKCIDDLGIPFSAWLALKSPSSSSSEIGVRSGFAVPHAEEAENGTTDYDRVSPGPDETIPTEKMANNRIEVMGLPAVVSRYLDREETPCRGAYFSACCSFSSSVDDDSSSTTTESSLFIVSPNGKFRRQIKSWQRGGVLGSGSFGTVYEGISSDGFFFAVKEVSLHGQKIEEQLGQLEHEIAMLSEFQHENIVQYLGSGKLLINAKLKLIRQILNGLKYLHDKGVVHRDIKCANILVDANGMVKLADFGLAKQVDKLHMLSSCKGTAYWMAPEVVRPRKPYGLLADIWSLGCTVLEMLTRQVPYAHLEPTAAIFKIGHGEPPPIPYNLSRDARDFIKQCLQVNPDKRPTASDLLEHPFVKSTSTASGPRSGEG